MGGAACGLAFTLCVLPSPCPPAGETVASSIHSSRYPSPAELDAYMRK